MAWSGFPRSSQKEDKCLAHFCCFSQGWYRQDPQSTKWKKCSAYTDWTQSNSSCWTRQSSVWVHSGGEAVEGKTLVSKRVWCCEQADVCVESNTYVFLNQDSVLGDSFCPDSTTTVGAWHWCIWSKNKTHQGKIILWGILCFLHFCLSFATTQC